MWIGIAVTALGHEVAAVWHSGDVRGVEHLALGRRQWSPVRNDALAARLWDTCASFTNV